MTAFRGGDGPGHPPNRHRSGRVPIYERLPVSHHYSGKGVTIAFIDSGFYAHPDLVEPHNRIASYFNIVKPRFNAWQELTNPDVSSWHGMMTSTVAAGNGFLSGGKYRGLAPDAHLVFLKVGSHKRIRHEDIEAALAWVVRFRDEFNIRVLNISCGGDFEASYLHDGLSRMAEEAVRDGVTVVAAAGNAGDTELHRVLPPASCPSVITVGGIEDPPEAPSPNRRRMYKSSYGPTFDGLQKPDIVAPAIWVAAPLLPGTPTAGQVKLLAELDAAPDEALHTIIAENPGVSRELDQGQTLDVFLLRNLIQTMHRDQHVIDSHYKFVDGTSFAAPIVAATVAQMLEANPALTPAQIRRCLVTTAEPLPAVPTAQQGFGVVNPAQAVAMAEKLR